MPYRWLYKLFCLFWLCIAASSATAEEKSLTAFINPSYIQSYGVFTQGRDPLTIRDFQMQGDQSNRFLVEMVLLQQFLQLGGL